MSPDGHRVVAAVREERKAIKGRVDPDRVCMVGARAEAWTAVAAFLRKHLDGPPAKKAP